MSCELLAELLSPKRSGGTCTARGWGEARNGAAVPGVGGKSRGEDPTGGVEGKRKETKTGGRKLKEREQSEIKIGGGGGNCHAEGGKCLRWK